MKKQLAFLSALLLLCGILLFPASAEPPVGAVTLRLRSDIAGCSSADYKQLMEIVSGNVVYGFSGDGPVSVADYGGTGESGRLVAGRTYSVTYLLEAADGYALPDEIGGVDLTIRSGKGVSVIATQIVTTKYRTGDGSFVTYKGLRILAQVVVDGSVFQRIAGFFTDLILKIKAWSLY